MLRFEDLHCAKNTRIRVFSGPYLPVGTNQRFCPYTGKYGSEKIVFWRILHNVSKHPPNTLNRE